ncbi:MAG: ATP-binding protein, partial [Streptosporangiaceae bacterium]
MSTCQVSPVLVGRADHLTQLDEGLAAAGLGEPTAVLIGGEAGVGKSRLVSEFAARVAGEARALTGGCLELGASGLPFAPFTGLLRQLVRELGLDGVAELLSGQGRRELARLLPELGEPASHDDEAYQGEARARLFEQMLTLFERLAASGPLVLIIEDAHWADRSTRDLLTYLIGNQQVMRGVLIVVTFRSDELHRGHPLRPLLAELGRIAWVRRLELPRLTRAEATAQIAAILTRDPEPAQADSVFRRSEGNPMFVEQLLCFDGELPESLRDLVLANVQRLPDDTRELLRIASAGGVRLGHRLLAAVSDAGDDDMSGALRPAVSGNVLLADEGGYQFRHALISEAMHDDLLPGEHSRLHARYAEAISADPDLVPTGRAAIEVAHHWYSAHDVTWALISAWEAAAEAGRALAYAEQLDMLSRVLELWDCVPDAATRIGADHVRVFEEAIVITHFTGDDDLGIGLATAALRELDADADPARTALLLEQRGLLRCVQDPEVGVADLRQALQLVSGGTHERERGRVLAGLGYMLSKARKAELAGPVAEEALVIARQTGDIRTRASALLTLAMLLPRADEAGYQAALDMLAQARAAASQAGDYHMMMNAIINESHLLEGMGEHARAAEVAKAGLVESQHYGLIRTSEAVLAVNQAEPLFALGRWDDASRVVVAALGSGSVRVSRSSLWQLAGSLALARGDLDRARDNEAVAVELLAGVAYRDQHHLPVAGLQIELRAAEGQLAAALAAAQDALGRYDLQATPRYAWP